LLALCLTDGSGGGIPEDVCLALEINGGWQFVGSRLLGGV
jgi:hypothetical protein